jgi:cyclophilin family peptidyl-prolyl cis-trans isomerase
MGRGLVRAVLACALVAAAVAFAACGDDDDGGDTQTDLFYGTQTAAAASGDARTPAAGDATAPAGATPSGGSTNGGKMYSAEPPMTIDQNKKYFATIKMDIGDIRLELFPQDAPRHVNNFVFLARDGFYDGVTFHRVIPGFVAQAGDPTGTGSGGPGYTIPDEVNSRKFLDGTLGMAKTSAPNSAGSQWFIDYAPQPNLDGGYTVFGQLVEGRDVLDKITPRDPGRATAPGTRINTITIEEQ